MQSGIKNTASSQGTFKIEPHTDGALTDNPPKYVALYGQYVPDDESCRTHVCKVSSLFGFLTSEERQILGFPELKGRSFRYSFQQALYGDFWISEEKLNKRPPDSPEVIAAANRMAEAFTKFGSSIKIGMGDLLIIDNQCSLHYRDNVSSPERHLLRYWIG
jgi:alpha-ketoglutarate-dependent taurine dioxygenase